MPDQICYRSIDGHELQMHCFRPAGKPTAAILFFHGGGWRNGHPKQFFSYCEALASDGLLACSAQYRLLGEQATTLDDCIADARAAVTWMRSEASAFGFDDGFLAVGGGSAGGHLAACCGIIDPRDDSWPAMRPDALVLFNPVIDQGPGGYAHALLAPDHLAYSPLHHIAEGLPPCCFLLGSEDNLIPVSTAVHFQERYQAAGSSCDLHLYGGQPHGFFNSDHDGGCYQQTLAVCRSYLADKINCNHAHGKPGD